MTVVVVGAGPVGVAAATLLARRGIDVLVLERHLAPYPLPRAVHLDDEIYRLLAELGVAEEFAAISRPIPGMRLLDARHRTIAELRRDASVGFHGHPQANLFDQPVLEALLLANLAREPRAALRRGAEVTAVVPRADGALVRYRHEDADHEIVARAVLGCDGANSVVRDAIGSTLQDLGFAERWLVIDVRSPRALDVWDGVHQICDPLRAATFMHVIGDRYRWEFRMHDGETSAALTADLAALLRPWFPDGIPADVALLRSAEYMFRAAIADRWRAGRVFLLGDAAHLTPPFIGQGLCTGMRDAANLAWKLAGVLHGALPDAALDSYELERKPSAVEIVTKAIRIGWALTGGQDGAAVLRRVLAAVLFRLPGVSQAALGTLAPRLGTSPLIEPAGPFVANGLLVPQSAAGLDARLGDAYALVTREPPAPELIARAEARGIRVADASAEPVLARFLRRHGSHAVLVRPDRIVAASARSRGKVEGLLERAPRMNLRETA